MSRLPVITGFGGISPAGRSSAHHGFRRLVIDALPALEASETWASLARLMGFGDDAGPEAIARMRAHTLVRRIEASHFDSERIPWNKRASVGPSPGAEGACLRISGAQAAEGLPEGWAILGTEGRAVDVRLDAPAEVLLPAERQIGRAHV